MKLGKFIELLERLPAATPVGLGRATSWRGDYEQLAFVPTPGVTAGKVLVEARAAVGSTFTGYKGGDFVMGLETDCYVAEYGVGFGSPSVGEYMSFLLLSWLEEKSYGVT